MKNNSLYKHFSAQEINPSGWLRRQLEIQAEGLSGNLDKIWPDVRDSAWIGGNRKDWERAPYWLDGFIPLAYLLENSNMITRAKKYIDAIIEGQHPDGWICPCTVEARGAYDVWASFLICKVLVLYFECSKDERIEKVIYNALKNLKQHLLNHTLFNWGQSRWFEALIPLYWLYDRNKEPWLVDLAVTLSTQGLDYKRLFTCWQDQEPRREWSFQTHIVNLMMALKSEALFSRLSGDDPNAFASEMLQKLLEHHGTAVGHISGDECLAGKSPVQGVELCSIVEALYSYELLFEITGNPSWADRAELCAFNSLPATISEDMRTHQYSQQINQIACCQLNEPPVYLTNSAESNVFGLEPNYGCCTANFNQAWPKLALSTFYRFENGVVSSVLVPSVLCCKIGEIAVKITLKTDYPFSGYLKYTIEVKEPIEFEFGIRIPSFASAATADGQTVKPGEIHLIYRKWNGVAHIDVQLEFTPTLNSCSDDTFCLQRGPLFFSVPIEARIEKREYVRNEVERKFPYCDFDLYPTSDWNYAFHSDSFKASENGITDYPFSHIYPPVMIETKLAQIDWGTMPGQPNVCNSFPAQRTALSYKTMTLQPYGCTALRMTQLPFVK